MGNGRSTLCFRKVSQEVDWGRESLGLLSLHESRQILMQ